MEYLLFIATDTEPGTPARRARTSTSGSPRATAAASACAATCCGRSRTPPPCACATARCSSPTARTPSRRSGSSGYDLLECDDLDQAIDYVSRHPMAHHGRIEIRPVAPLEE